MRALLSVLREDRPREFSAMRESVTSTGSSPNCGAAAWTLL